MSKKPLDWWNDVCCVRATQIEMRDDIRDIMKKGSVAGKRLNSTLSEQPAYDPYAPKPQVRMKRDKSPRNPNGTKYVKLLLWQIDEKRPKD